MRHMSSLSLGFSSFSPPMILDCISIVWFAAINVTACLGTCQFLANAVSNSRYRASFQEECEGRAMFLDVCHPAVGPRRPSYG